MFFAVVAAALPSSRPLLPFAPLVGAVELTLANRDAEAAGKTIFIKVLAPWCGHRKSLQPAWDQLTTEFKDNKTALVGEVDCTSPAGEKLCGTHDVQGYPTLKFRDPSDELMDAAGGRSFTAFRAFAAALQLLCSPSHRDLCDDAAKKRIEAFDALRIETLGEKIRSLEAKIKAAEAEMMETAKKLKAMYNVLQGERRESEVGEGVGPWIADDHLHQRFGPLHPVEEREPGSNGESKDDAPLLN